eukprot:TRINITY_DN4466_c1_g1_i6.p5 TRINITY_DN4466_c1_g1~~TRINITY_DN4466_c1_g1_i6.p5  ORF type:complete len:132 (-),score=6.56 TRINITY_DN4466_c1_g1_i6:556-951(-)
MASDISDKTSTTPVAQKNPIKILLVKNRIQQIGSFAGFLKGNMIKVPANQKKNTLKKQPKKLQITELKGVWQIYEQIIEPPAEKENKIIFNFIRRVIFRCSFRGIPKISTTANQKNKGPQMQMSVGINLNF